MKKIEKSVTDEIKRLYLHGLTLKQLCEQTKVSESTVCKAICGLERIRPYRDMRKKLWNKDFFKQHNETTAYWSGFFIADGALVRLPYGSFNLTLELARKDNDHLLKFCQHVNLDEKTKTRRNGVYITLTAKFLGEDLLPWGITPNKTYEPTIPTVSLANLPHFLRGWFDGDGNAIFTKWQERFVLTGNLLLLQWYADALIRLGYKGHYAIRKEKEDHVWGKLLIYGKSNLSKVFSLLDHKNTLKLDRKYGKVRQCSI